MTAQLKIGFLTNQNPYNRNSYSGALYFMLRALESHPGFNVELLGGYRPIKEGILGRLFPGSKDQFHFKREEFQGLDAVIAPVASDLVARYGSKIGPPIMLITDTTPSYLREFYPEAAAGVSDDTEIEAFSNTESVVYSSQYMADRAQGEFANLSGKLVGVAPLGINLFNLPSKPMKKDPMEPLEMVFIGKNWKRKGGDIALKTLNELRIRGINAHLKIIGPSLPETRAHNHVEVLGYIDKHRPKEAGIYERALKNAHVLISPTRADCTPMVIAEANMFSCPVAITEVGGVSSLMRSGVNGEMLQVNDGPKEWADVIENMTIKNNDYEALCCSSFEYAQLRLSWEAWAQSIFEYTYEAINK